MSHIFSLLSQKEKAMLQEKKKMIEAKTEMWAHHSGANSWQVLNAITKTNGAYPTGTGNMVPTTPVLPPLHGTSLSPAIVQQ